MSDSSVDIMNVSTGQYFSNVTLGVRLCSAFTKCLIAAPGLAVRGKGVVSLCYVGVG